MDLILSEVCEVCTHKGGTLEVFHGYAMHPKCAPAHWLKDRRDMEQLVDMGRTIGKEPW